MWAISSAVRFSTRQRTLPKHLDRSDDRRCARASNIRAVAAMEEQSGDEHDDPERVEEDGRTGGEAEERSVET